MLSCETEQVRYSRHAFFTHTDITHAKAYLTHFKNTVYIIEITLVEKRSNFAFLYYQHGTTNGHTFFIHTEIYVAFTHVGLTTRKRMKSLYKRIFVLSRSRDEEDRKPVQNSRHEI